MKKTLKFLTLSAFLAMTCTFAMADGNAFTPLNFDDASYGNVQPQQVKMTSQQGQDLVGNGRMQNAILELENAQVDVRNDLLNYKAKYSEVDNQYNLVKAERKGLNKQIKAMERRIKKIDRQKEAIRKNMI